MEHSTEHPHVSVRAAASLQFRHVRLMRQSIAFSGMKRYEEVELVFSFIYCPLGWPFLFRKSKSPSQCSYLLDMQVSCPHKTTLALTPQKTAEQSVCRRSLLLSHGAPTQQADMHQAASCPACCSRCGSRTGCHCGRGRGKESLRVCW